MDPYCGSHYINRDTPSRLRSPSKAVGLLEAACRLNHAPSCYNLATLYRLGDDGVSVNAEKHEEFKLKTQKLVGEKGSLQGTKTG